MGWTPLTASIRAAGPVGLWQFNEVLPNGTTVSGSQDPQGFALDSSASGNLNQNNGAGNPNGNYLTYGSAVIGNTISSASTLALNAQSVALFPSTATAATANIITGGSAQPPILQPTAAISVGCQVVPNVIVGGAKQVMVCYGSDASSLAAYNLYHTGSTAVNHQFAFSINIGGALKTATATVPLLVVGTPYFVMGTYDGVNVRIYVNGVLQGTTAATGSISYASIGAYGLAFGNDPSLSDGNLQGAMGIAGIYNYALSQATLTYLARQGQITVPFPWRH